MNEIIFYRTIGVVCVFLQTCFVGYRVYVSKGLEREITTKIFIATFVLLLWSLKHLFEAYNWNEIWIISSITNSFYHIAALISYFISEQLCFGREYHPIIIVERKITIITIILILSMIFVDFLRRDTYVSPTTIAHFQPSLLYTLSYIIYYGTLIFLGIACIHLYWAQIRQTKNAILNARFVMLLIVFGDGTFLAVVAIFNLFLVHNQIYSYGVSHFVEEIGSAICFFFSIMTPLPNSFYDRITAPIKKMSEARLRSRDELYYFLHSQMSKITSITACNAESLIDILIETSDMRQVILSHMPLRRQLSAKQEALMIIELLEKGITYSSFGKYEPVVNSYDITKHNIRVAKILKKNLIVRNRHAQV